MIVNLILAAITTVLTWVFSLLPVYEAPVWLSYESGGYSFFLGSLVYKLNAWLPTAAIATAFQWLGLIIPIVVTGIVVLWLWAIIPVFGKKG